MRVSLSIRILSCLYLLTIILSASVYAEQGKGRAMITVRLEKEVYQKGEEIKARLDVPLVVTSIGLESNFSQSSSQVTLDASRRITLGRVEAAGVYGARITAGADSSVVFFIAEEALPPNARGSFRLTPLTSESKPLAPLPSSPSLNAAMKRFGDNLTADHVKLALNKTDYKVWFAANTKAFTESSIVCLASIMLPKERLECLAKLAGLSSDFAMEVFKAAVKEMPESKLPKGDKSLILNFIEAAGVVEKVQIGSDPRLLKLFNVVTTYWEAVAEDQNVKVTIRIGRDAVNAYYTIAKFEKKLP